MKVVATRTVMNEPEVKTRLAEETVKLAESIKK